MHYGLARVFRESRLVIVIAFTITKYFVPRSEKIQFALWSTWINLFNIDLAKESWFFFFTAFLILVLYCNGQQREKAKKITEINQNVNNKA